MSEALWREADGAGRLALRQLMALGFPEEDSKRARQAAHFEASEAAELLLLAGAGELEVGSAGPRTRWMKRVGCEVGASF